MPALEAFPASILLLIAQWVSPPLLKHTFRSPGYRASHRSLLAASATCHALRRACFPLAIRIFRNRDPKPLSQADIGESATELDRRIEWVLTREDLWPYIKLVDIELFARGSHSLGTHLASFISALPNLESFALRLPTYRVFRNVLTSDLRASFSKCASVRVRTLCVDTDSAWLIPLFPNLRELIVWSWPRPGREEDDRAGGWSVVLGSISAQAPNVSELEIGGLSIWDVNVIFPALANALGKVQILRVLHRSEPYGAIPLDTAIIPHSPTVRTTPLPASIQSCAQTLWEDSHADPEYEGRYITGCPGALKKIVYFGLQDECGSCYVPCGTKWKDIGPAVVLGSEDMKDRS